jgi:dihydroxyacetone kinase-like protein
MSDIETGQLIEIIRAVTVDVEAEKAHLNGLDAALGDGDHGISMTIGARAVRKSLDGFADLDVSEVLRRCGEILQSSAGATVGALLGSGLAKVGGEMASRDVLKVSDIEAGLGVIVAEIRRLGGADAGDKTLLDALIPAWQAASRAVADGRGAVEVFECARDAAKAGMESTDQMAAKKGRASRLGARTIGYRDPGATTVYIILRSIASHLREQESRSELSAAQ